MFGATLYIITCTAKNRTKQRLRRLREPRYLFGAVAGMAYLIFTLFIRERAYRGRDGRERSTAGAATASALGAMGPSLGGALLACAAVAAWLMPFNSSLLEFSKAETAFLFPSPLSRRQLVVYRLMRSQFAVLTGALIMALAYPTGSLFGRLRGLIGVWIILMTSRVFFAGVTLARSRMRRREGRRQWFVWPALVISGGAVLSVLVPLISRAQRTSLDTIPDVLDAVVSASQQGATRMWLWPFSLLIRPLLAQTLEDFGTALVGAIGVYLVAVAWLIWADAMSQDAADASAERQVNQGTRRARAYVARPVRWQLGLSGRPEVAFIWKGVLQTFRTVNRRVLIRILLLLAWMVSASFFVTRTRGLLLVFGVFATWGALFAVFMAPQVIRMDLREDLAHLELLKTWPIRGAAVIRGEIIWPTIVVTVLAWGFAVLASVLSLSSLSRIPLPNRGAAWLSFLVLVPGVVLAQYTMHNAVAVIFPGWVPLGASRPRGVDAAGQRLIVLLANWVGLLIALLPGVATTAVLSLLLRPIIGPWVLPLGALLTTLVVVGEMLVATEVLGPVFERLDVTSVERPD